MIESVVRLTASRSLIVSAVLEKNADTLQTELNKTLSTEKLDIFTLVNSKGVVICREEVL